MSEADPERVYLGDEDDSNGFSTSIGFKAEKALSDLRAKLEENDGKS